MAGEEKARRAVDSKATILIADDDPKLRKTLSDILRVKGYAPLAVAKGRTALAKLKKKTPAVAIIDLRLDDMSGLEVLRGIKDQSPDTECIVLTGYASQESAIEAVNLGAYSYMQKPYDIEQLLLTIHRAIEKREAELALRESEERYRLVVESASEAIALLDLKGNIREVNLKALEISGFDREDIVGKNFVELLPSLGLDGPSVLRAFKDAVRDRYRGAQEWTITNKEGQRITFVPRYALIRKNGTASGVSLIFQDITERKLAEEALKESEEKFRSLAEQSPNMIFINQKGRVVYANEMCEEIMGYTRKELYSPDFNFLSLIGPESMDAIRENFTRHMRGEEVPPVAYTLITRGGERIEAILATKLIRYGGEGAILGVVTDITERKQAEEAYRAVAEHSLQGLVIVQDFQIMFVNQAFADISGYTIEELLSLAPEEVQALVHPEDQELAWGRFRDRLAGKPVPPRFEYRGIRKDGTVVWAEMFANPIEYRGKPAVQAALLDITERRRAEEELEESLEKLRNTLTGTVKALASMAEKRDPYTSGHQQEVARLAVAIAKIMGLSQERIEAIRVAATVHDIGKTYVPAEILSKPSELSESEFGMIKAHPQAVYDIVREIEFPWPVAQIVIQHHERMDGTGYPQGLSGKEILLEARILAVADVVEAMSSRRPYRPALGIDEALEEIRRNRGALYDPEVVDACLKLFIDEGFELMEK
jgi:PAS domain S-box-containing protein/putative nucleotidyltransferase with HDIG domain